MEKEKQEEKQVSIDDLLVQAEDGQFMEQVKGAEKDPQQLETVAKQYTRWYNREMPAKIRDYIAERFFDLGNFHLATPMYADKELGKERISKVVEKSLKGRDYLTAKLLLETAKRAGYETLSLPGEN